MKAQNREQGDDLAMEPGVAPLCRRTEAQKLPLSPPHFLGVPCGSLRNSCNCALWNWFGSCLLFIGTILGVCPGPYCHEVHPAAL